MQIGILGACGFSLADGLRLQAATEAKNGDSAPAKNVLQIVLPGGCVHQESWDPKPEAPIEYRGALGVTKTVLPGEVFSQNLAKCGQIADKLMVTTRAIRRRE